MIKNGFDLSAMKNVGTPSPQFSQFLDQYFLVSQYFLRREEDPNTYFQLSPEEKKVAVEIIRTNVRLGYEHLIDAVSILKLTEIVPILKSMLPQAEYPTNFVIARSLRSMNMLSANEVFPILEETAMKAESYYGTDAMRLSYQLLPLEWAAEIIEIGMKREHYSIRCSAYDALLAMEYIRDHGGVYTPELGHTIFEKEMSWAIKGSMEQDRYPIYRDVFGEDVYDTPAKFEDGIRPYVQRLRKTIAK